MAQCLEFHHFNKQVNSHIRSIKPIFIDVRILLADPTYDKLNDRALNTVGRSLNAKRHIAFISVNAGLGMAICIGFTVTYTNYVPRTIAVTTWIRILLILCTLPDASKTRSGFDSELRKKRVQIKSPISAHGKDIDSLSCIFSRILVRVSSLRNEIFAQRRVKDRRSRRFIFYSHDYSRFFISLHIFSL